MEVFWFYLKLGFWHVLDFNAYDHILFIIALTIPFTISRWKSVILLATLFTIAHCTSLALSVYGVMYVDTPLIEFLIPITICATAIFNIIYARSREDNRTLVLHVFAAIFFGFIHGFGFSNYFGMMVAEEANKLPMLLSFAVGIELSQIVIIFMVLIIGYFIEFKLHVDRAFIIVGSSILLFLITIPMLIETFPW